MNKTQDQLFQWLETNFRNELTDSELILQQLAGMIEEVGELTHSVLKLEQGIRKDENHIDNIYDAIGDILIFGSNFLSILNLDIGPRLIEPRNKIKIKYKLELILQLNKQLNKLSEHIVAFFIEEDYSKCVGCYEDYKECQESFERNITKIFISICDILQSILTIYMQPMKIENAFKVVSLKILKRNWNKHREEHGNKD
jgi:NTP pyrophosphatase (non-canonical NTP hydrolase)